MRVVLACCVLLGCSKGQPMVGADPAPSVSSAVVKTPRVVASGQAHPWGVYVDATHVYWSNKGAKGEEGTVMRVAKSGGPAQRIGFCKAPYGIAVTGPYVHWSCTSPLDGGLASAKLEFIGKGHVRAPSRVPWALTRTSTHLFWTELASREIASAPVDGSGTPGPGVTDWTRTVVHATASGHPVGLAVDDTFVYWTDSDPGVVAKTPIAGGPITTLVTGGEKTMGIAVDDTHVYWSEWGSGRIAKILKEGGASVTLASDQKGARSIAIDATRLYFTHPPSGSVRSVAKNGGAVITHATGQKQPYSVAVDEANVYWANVDGDTVMAIAK